MPTATTTPTTPVDDIGGGPLSPGAAQRVIDHCARSMGFDAGRYAPVFTQEARTGSGAVAVVLARDAATGTEYLCRDAAYGTDGSMVAGPQSKSVVEQPSADRPLTSVDAGGWSYATPLDRPGVVTDLGVDRSYRVDPAVGRVEMRVGTATAPGTWRSAVPSDGYVYVAAWADTELPLDGIVLETRAFDTAGRPLASDLLGTERPDLGSPRP
ncbi:hypothetical protein [Nocardioides humi]|uniref:hypothetical protein n=1 Tax=Nocardioides humi TaxID=449461 RepID=UPI0011264F31|nr:hypothetical protein [Nocardioides humi]